MLKRFILPDLSALNNSPNVAADLEILTAPRRERFVFRSNHLEILEKSFAEDNYPSYEKREEIARACNIATEAIGRCSLKKK